MSQSPPRYAHEARLRFLDGLLFWEGRVNRRDLIDAFRVSQPQAALDLKAYLATLAPGQVFYDTRQRRYEATPSFRPIYGIPDIGPWLERSRLSGLSIEVLPTLNRPLDHDLMAKLYRAIRDRVAIIIAYQTMRRAEAEDRPITPTAFVSDGQRWHVRAYCHLRKGYRDFVLSRIAWSEASMTEEHHTAHPPVDLDWETWVTLWLAPAAHLEDNQRRAVCWDYGITQGHLTIQVRRALEFYAMRRWGLDRPESRLSTIERFETAPPADPEVCQQEGYNRRLQGDAGSEIQQGGEVCGRVGAHPASQQKVSGRDRR
jgi:hypothetical protein